MYIFKINSDYFISMGLVLHVVGLFSLVKYVGAKFKDDLAKNKSISASVFGVLGVCVIVLFLTPIFIVDWLLFQKMKNIFF